METIGRPFEKYDGIRIEGVHRLLSVIDVVPCFERGLFIVTAEDVDTLETITVTSDKCHFVSIGQMDLFSELVQD